MALTAWACSTCPYPVGWSVSADVGIAFAMGVTPWAGRYTGLYENAAYPVLDAELLLQKLCRFAIQRFAGERELLQLERIARSHPRIANHPVVGRGGRDEVRQPLA